MNETEQAIQIANKALDRVGADPDDDLAILARQFLRARETLDKIADPLAISVGGIGFTRTLNLINKMREMAAFRSL